MTLHTLYTQVPDRTLVPYGGRRPGQNFLAPDRGTTQETGSLGVLDRVIVFFVLTSQSLPSPEGLSGPHLDDSPSREGWEVVCRVDTYVPLCFLGTPTYSGIDDR